MASNVTMEELKILAQQPGVTLTGGGSGYNPNARENQWESRYDNDGNVYNARITVPMMRGHSRDPKTVIPIAELLFPTGQKTKFGREIFKKRDGTTQSEQSVTVSVDGKFVNAPSLQPDINPDRLLTHEEVKAGILNGTIEATSTHSDKPTAIAAAKKHSRSIDENLYNRQGRANYKSQDTDNPETVWGDPELGSLPDLTMDAYAEMDWDDEQDRQANLQADIDDEVETREMLADWDVDTQMDTQMSGASDQFDKLDIDWEDRNALRVLQNLRLKEVEAKRQEQFAPADFNPEEFRQRIANRSTPDWLGESEGPMTDATRASDTDDFGNLLSTDAFGQTNYEASINQRLNVLNNQSGGINYKKPVAIQSVQPEPRSNYPKHFTPWMVDQLESQRKRKEMVQGIGDTVTGVYDDVTGFDYKGLGSDIYNKGANAVQGVQDLYTDFNKPGVSTPPVDTRPEYPSHLTSYAIEQLEGQRKRKEFIQGIGNKVSDITESFNAWKNRNFK